MIWEYLLSKYVATLDPEKHFGWLEDINNLHISI